MWKLSPLSSCRATARLSESFARSLGGDLIDFWVPMFTFGPRQRGRTHSSLVLRNVQTLSDNFSARAGFGIWAVKAISLHLSREGRTDPSSLRRTVRSDFCTAR